MASQTRPAAVYLASALSNADLNRLIASVISALGHDCYLPQDDPVNKSDNVPGKLIAARNIQQIDKCDYLIAVYRNMGRDTCWEIGYAKGLLKPCFLICSNPSTEEAKLSPMSFFSVDAVIFIPNWDAPAEVLGRAIDNVIRGYRAASFEASSK